MRPAGCCLRGLGKGVLSAILLSTCGCLGFLHPIDPGPLAETEPCKDLPRCCREHVYVFLMNGLDPVNYGNLAGLRDYLNGLGISKTYYGQIYHVWWFASEMRRIQQEDPSAKFVLIGFSLGVNLVDGLARSVQADGIRIDLMVFLSGNHPVQPMPPNRPENVERVINILAGGIMGARGERDWAENLRLSGKWHFDTPTNPQTLDVLAREMAAISSTVPVTEVLPPPLPPSDEEAPPPHPVHMRTSARHGEWDFLKPVARLSEFRHDDLGAPDRPTSPGQYPVTH